MKFTVLYDTEMARNCWIVGSLGCVFVLIVENLRLRSEGYVLNEWRSPLLFWPLLIKILAPPLWLNCLV